MKKARQEEENLMTSILVTGGAGYIGSHICKALRRAGFDPVPYDNLSWGNPESVKWGRSRLASSPTASICGKRSRARRKHGHFTYQNATRLSQHRRDARRRGRRDLQMMLIDANILIYARVSSFVQHNPARDWLDQQLNGLARVGLPWISLVAFLRLVTNPRVFYPVPRSIVTFPKHRSAIPT